MPEAWTTGVWIDVTSSVIVRWSPRATVRHHLYAEAPMRRRVGARLLAPEPSDVEQHRRAFIAQVMHTLPGEDDLLLTGDAAIVAAFASLIRANDATAGRSRRVEVQSGGPLSERQLINRIRAFAGAPLRPRRPRPATGGASRS
jgi:hypothetical protein